MRHIVPEYSAAEKLGYHAQKMKTLPINTDRIQSIDFLRGLVMIIMALDHVRAYFHFDTFMFSPTDLERTSIAMFGTRLITHLCAPTFIFLSGTSAYFIAQRKTLEETSMFLLTRGLWLVVLQVSIIQFGWNFDPGFHYTSSNIISTIGFCMMLLALLIHLPFKAILVTGLGLIALHNTLDNISFESGSIKDIVWSFLHRRNDYITGAYYFRFLYPIIPWIGVMAAGFCFGRLYDQRYFNEKKKTLLLQLGSLSLIAFVILRGLNNYGDPTPWTEQQKAGFTILSFLNVEKYPPSLLFLCLTLGVSLVILGLLEGKNLDRVRPITLFGKVALFYYIAHIYTIHLLALVTVSLMGYPWQTMIFLEGPHNYAHPLIKGNFGFGLGVTYLIWISVVCFLYPLCVYWNSFKISNKTKWWVSYV